MKELALKYGCNPNQKPSRIYMDDGRELPIEVINGRPGYINFLDAFNSWQLVKELKAATGMPAAASFNSILLFFARIIIHEPILRSVQSTLEIIPTLESGKQRQLVQSLAGRLLLPFQNIPHFVENMSLANLLFYVFSKDFQILFHNNPLIFTNWEQKY
jgi:hypothetical protein